MTGGSAPPGAGPRIGPGINPNVQTGLRLGVIVPCRNELGVIQRRIANLSRLHWPPGRQRLLIVDDGSDDGTAERARALLAEAELGADVRAEVLSNQATAGKPGAIATGLAALGESVDLIVLTDADVVLARDALTHLRAAFDSRPGLAMACGGQLFVTSLDAAGVYPGEEGQPFELAGGRYDSWTAAIRRLESKSGRLFSVHGQLLCWRRTLELVPAPGIAADDLDLRLQVRARSGPPRDVCLCPEARFAEVKESTGRDAQALRRARAYVQTIVLRKPPRLPSRLDRAQLALYRRLPLLAPWCLLFGLLAVPLLAGWLGGPRSALMAAFGTLALFALPFVRRLARLCIWIARATRAERRKSMGDRWEMARR